MLTCEVKNKVLIVEMKMLNVKDFNFIIIVICYNCMNYVNDLILY